MKKRIVLIALLGAGLVVPKSCYALLASDIISRARVYLKDQSTVNTRQQFSDATLLAFENDGQRELVASSWILQTTLTVSLSNGTGEYTLPTNFLAPVRCLISSAELYQTTQPRLDSETPTWRSQTGTPSLYYIYYTTNPTIGFSPIPNGSFTATLYYANTVNDMAATSETPFNGYAIMAQYQTGLIDYVVCRAYLTLEEPELASPYCGKWSSYMSSAKAGLMVRPTFTLTPKGPQQ